MFRLVETHGVQLDIILQKFDQEGLVVDWIDFFENSIKGGWNRKTIFKKVKYSLEDVFGKEHSDKVVKYLMYYDMKNNALLA